MLCSCEKETMLDISETEIVAPSEGLSKTISISTNKDWSASSSEGWCTVSPSSGNSSVTSVTITVAANDTYDPRSCIVTITAKELSIPITVSQETNLGLLVSPDRYELNNDAQEIEVEVKANVDYDVAITGDWIQRNTTKALVTTKLYFNIAKNDSYDNREGSITISQKDGNLTSTIKVFQSQTDAIIISKKQFGLTSASHSLEVELKTNVEFDVIIPESVKDWVSYTGTKALYDETLLIRVKANENYDARTAEVYVKNKATSLQDTLFITQNQLDGLILTKTEYEMGTLGGVIDVELKSNVDYEIIVTEKWITEIATKGLETYNHQFAIDTNKTYDDRTGQIVFKDKASSLSDTVFIYQSRIDTVYTNNNQYEIEWRGGQIELTLYYSTDYTIDQMPEWITEAPATKALEEKKLSLIIAENLDTTRVANIIVNWSNEGVETKTEIEIKQHICRVNVTVPGTIEDYFTSEEKLRIKKIIVSGTLNNYDFLTLREMAQLEVIDISHITNTTIPNGFFKNNTIVKNVNLPNDLESIPSELFSGSSIQNIKIPSSVKTLGDKAFYQCFMLESIIIPDNVETMGTSCFVNCHMIKKVYISKNITNIPEYSFWNSPITELILHDDITNIGYGAFISYKGTELTLPENLINIDQGAFGGCINLEGPIVIPHNVVSIGSQAFQDSKKVTRIYCKNIVPPSLAFFDQNDDPFPNWLYLGVPKGTKELYKNAPVWNKFVVIEEVDFDALGY